MQNNIRGNDGVFLDRGAGSQEESNMGMGTIIALVVLLLVVGTFILHRHLAVDSNPAAFLPADTLAYIDQRHAQERGQRFLASSLGKAVTSIDLPGLVHDLGAPEGVQADLQDTVDKIKEVVGSKITEELLGNRFVVALLPRRDWMKELGASPDPRWHLVLICQPRHGAAAMDILSSLFSGDLKTEIVPYGGYSLKRFKNDQISFVACTVKGWLVAAFEERALREALDAFDAGANSLAASQSFKKITADLPPESQQIVYLRPHGLAGLVKASLAQAPSRNQAALAGHLDAAMARLDAFAYGSWMINDVFEERMFVSFILDKATATVRKILTTPPQKDELLSHLRDNILLYSYSAISDSSGVFASLKPEQRAKIEALTGHSLQELQQMLGDGPTRLFLRQGADGQTLPLPLANFCVKAAAPAKLSEIASTLLTQAGIEMSKGEFQDASYQVWSKAPEKNLRLYSALWRGQWCLGNSLDFFKEIAEQAPADQSLLTAKDFKAVADGVDVDQPAPSLMYVRVDQSLDLLRHACGWLATILAVKDKGLSAKAKLVNERLIFPILDGAKMYQSSFSRCLVENNMLKVDFRTSMTPVEVK